MIPPWAKWRITRKGRSGDIEDASWLRPVEATAFPQARCQKIVKETARCPGKRARSRLLRTGQADLTGDSRSDRFDSTTLEVEAGDVVNSGTTVSLRKPLVLD